MSKFTVRSAVVVGVVGHVVEVTATVRPMSPGFVIVGLPDAVLSETCDRVRAAWLSTRLPWPAGRIEVLVSPVSLPKRGTSLDLAIAEAIAGAQGLLSGPAAPVAVAVAELGLDGRLWPVRGIYAMVSAAADAAHAKVVVPTFDQVEACLVEGVSVFGATTLADAPRIFGTEVPAPQVNALQWPSPVPFVEPSINDLGDVLGQDGAKFALEVAAAGGHHLLLKGPGGAGKTMLASCLPGLLPDLDEAASREVTAIESAAGGHPQALATRPPFEAPHHTLTSAAMVGGAGRPGAVTRAHRGVLALDDAPEIAPSVLQLLREALETGEVIIRRASATMRLPAQFQLALTAADCPYGGSIECQCSPMQRRRYLARLSGPLLDRVDITCHVEPLNRKMIEKLAGQPRESSAIVAERVAKARCRQEVRWADAPWSLNAHAPGAVLREGIDAHALAVIDEALETGTLSLRGADRVLRLAYTIADLAGREPNAGDVQAALRLRHA